MLQYKLDIVQKLSEKGYNPRKIRNDRILAESTMSKLRRKQAISWENIDTICGLLQCQPGDLLEWIDDEG